MSVTDEPVWQIELFHQWQAVDPSVVKNIQNGLDILLPAGASFACTTNDRLVENILVELGASRVNTLNYFRLEKQDVPALTGAYPPNGLVFEIHDYVPEVYYKAFADLMTVCMNDIVREDPWELFKESEEGLAGKISQFKASGTYMLVGMLLTPSTELVGLSIILVHQGDTIATQLLTGIAPPYRGKGWATFLKDSLTREALYRYDWVDALETNCYEANKAIIHLNLEMGYQWRETKFQYMGRLG